ncbi:hypothetical protein [Cytobacillus gottheilii]|uniref:hypothetical protein n=1 Tax=Cytobacillus gottheilii TaxID=859144 RepID=UPI002494E493|nr:hypothetical protein [Cytobacillus gottheilii]
MMKKIDLIQADIIFKALYYTARNEKLELPEELTTVYEVLAEQNPNNTYAEHTLDVMKYLVEFIRSSKDYKEYFLSEKESKEN